MARWLRPSADASFEFLARAFSPPWEGPLAPEVGADGQVGSPVSWEPVPASRQDSAWRHEVLRCSRPWPLPEEGPAQTDREGCDEEVPAHTDQECCDTAAAGLPAASCHICIHRLTLAQGAAEGLNRYLAALALEKEGAAVGCAREASNIGGFHSEVDLMAWEEMRSCPLPGLLEDALRQVDQFECDGVGRQPCDFEERPEAWVNVSRRGHWNHLHSHPGSTFSGTYYVSDGGCRSGGEQSLSGRLVLLPAAPPRLARHNLEHLHRAPGSGEGGPPGPAAGGEAEEAEGEGAEAGGLVFLAVDPVPGSLLVFPSFVPHFVLPMQGPDSEKNEAEEQCIEVNPRVSVAFNFVSR